MLQGWIAIHRGITENFVWKDKPFSRGQAWIDLLLMANHEPDRIKTRTGFVEIERGSLHTEERSLQGRWGWSRSKVRLFLCLLESEKMISKTIKKSTTGRTTEGTTIKIINYGVYQDIKSGKEPTKKPQKDQRETTERPPRDLNNNDNNDNNANKPTYSENPELEKAILAFVEFRTEIKKRLSPHALDLILKRLDTLADTDEKKIAVLNQSIMYGWQGIFELKDPDGVKQPNTDKSLPLQPQIQVSPFSPFGKHLEG